MAARKKTTTEKITHVPISELYERTDNPIKMRNDRTMVETLESVKKYGVLSPGIVRPRAEGGYEIIAGRRRKLACEAAGLDTMPVIIRNLNEEQAIIEMIDSGIQREEVLPSEKAAAYKLKLEAIKRRAGRPAKDAPEKNESNSVQLGQNYESKTSREILAAQAPDSSTQIQRYIRLTELSPELQAMVDEKKIAMTPAVELSYLKPEEQAMLVTTIDYEQATPSLSQAQRMKKQSQEGTLTEDSILAIMCEQKKPAWDNVTLKGKALRKYFPQSYTPLQIEKIIYRLLEQWAEHQEQKAG